MPNNKRVRVLCFFLLSGIISCVPPQKRTEKPPEPPATSATKASPFTPSASHPTSTPLTGTPNSPSPLPSPDSPCGSRSSLELIELPVKEIYRLPVRCQAYLVKSITQLYSAGLGEDLKIAIHHLEKLTEIEPGYGVGFYLLSTAYYKSGDPKKAYETVMKAFENDKSLSLHGALVAIEFLTYDLKKLEDAERLGKHLIEIDPRYVEGRMLYANILFEEGKKREAEQEYREVLKLFPKNAGAKLKLGQLLMEQKRYSEAEKFLLEAADVFNRSPFPLQKLAELYHARGDQRKALVFLEKFREKGGDKNLYLQLKQEFLKNRS